MENIELPLSFAQAKELVLTPEGKDAMAAFILTRPHIGPTELYARASEDPSAVFALLVYCPHDMSGGVSIVSDGIPNLLAAFSNLNSMLSDPRKAKVHAVILSDPPFGDSDTFDSSAPRFNLN